MEYTTADPSDATSATSSRSWARVSTSAPVVGSSSSTRARPVDERDRAVQAAPFAARQRTGAAIEQTAAGPTRPRPGRWHRCELAASQTAQLGEEPQVLRGTSASGRHRSPAVPSPAGGGPAVARGRRRCRRPGPAPRRVAAGRRRSRRRSSCPPRSGRAVRRSRRRETWRLKPSSARRPSKALTSSTASSVGSAIPTPITEVDTDQYLGYGLVSQSQECHQIGGFGDNGAA